jgi:hypothetical protein
MPKLIMEQRRAMLKADSSSSSSNLSDSDSDSDSDSNFSLDTSSRSSNSSSDDDSVADVHPRLVIVEYGLLLVQDQKMILDQSRGLHRCLLVMDKIGMMAIIVVRTVVNGSEIKTEIGVLLRVSRLRLHLLVG